MFLRVHTWAENEILLINLSFVLAIQDKAGHAVLHIVDPHSGKEWLELKETVDEIVNRYNFKII